MFTLLVAICSTANSCFQFRYRHILIVSIRDFWGEKPRRKTIKMSLLSQHGQVGPKIVLVLLSLPLQNQKILYKTLKHVF